MRNHACVRSVASWPSGYRGTLLMGNTTLLGPYSRTVPRALWWSKGGGLFLLSEVPLFSPGCCFRPGPVRKTMLSLSVSESASYHGTSEDDSNRDKTLRSTDGGERELQETGT